MQQPSSDIIVFDRVRIRQNRRRAAGKFNDHRFLSDWAAKNLADRLTDIRKDFETGLHIGPGTELFKCPLISMDLCEQRRPGLAADEEFLPFAEGSLDLILSTLSLHQVNDLPGTLTQINRALKPDGLFMASMLGGETLHELRSVMTEAELSIKGGASPRIAPFADKQQMGSLLQRAGFALPVVDSEFVTVTYENAFKLMHDLRGMGEGNAIAARNRTPPGKTLMMEAARLYQEKFAESDGRIPATFEIIFLIGWAPHESQPKPLRPGQADRSLAEALDAEEISAGEKAAP